MSKEYFGERMQNLKLEIGKKYLIDHSRKGRFVGKVISQDEEWATVEVVEGSPIFIADMNQDRGFVGDEITIRKSMINIASEINETETERKNT